MNQRIAAAIENTKRLQPDYWRATLAQRLPGGAGSMVAGFTTPQTLESGILGAEWTRYAHANILEGCVAFITGDITGYLGMVPIKVLPPDTVITLDDRKDTGTVSCTVKGVPAEKVDFTIIILGPDSDTGEEIVYTFFPGEPTRPQMIETKPGMHGKEISVAEAQRMGFSLAKIAA